MLHLIPARLHRALYRVADRARRTWWLVRKPRGGSIHVVAFDEAGRVLLVRHSYGPAVWSVPGGGVGRGEDPATAAAREMREELGCELAELVAMGPCHANDLGPRNLQHLFAARLAGKPVADLREIVALEWFDPDALPANASRYVPSLIRQARAGKDPS